MKTKTLLIALITISTILNSCKKYEDGPGISFRTKKHRIEGKWKVSSVLVDNQEEIDHLEKGTGYKILCQSGVYHFVYDLTIITNYHWEINKDGSLNESLDIIERKANLNSTYFKCTDVFYPDSKTTQTNSASWEFDKKKENIFVTSNTGYRDTYQILELKEKQIKLKRIDIDGSVSTTLIFKMEKE